MIKKTWSFHLILKLTITKRDVIIRKFLFFQALVEIFEFFSENIDHIFFQVLNLIFKGCSKYDTK